MIAGEIGVDALIKFSVTGIAHVQRLVAAIIFGQLLLDDVGLNGYTQMVGLAGEVGGEVIILVLLKSVVAEVAPQNSSHTQFMRGCEGLADLHDLSAALLRTKINGGTY